MAETIATGYIQLMPSAKGMKAAIESELRGSVATPLANEAKAASTQVSQTLATAVQRDAAPAMGRAVATQLQAGAKTASAGIVAQIKGVVSSYGGAGAVVQGLAGQAGRATERLRGLVQGSTSLSSSTGVMKAGLLGVTGLLGGPWGVAIAGAGLAINGFAQAQQNAADAAQRVNDTLDQQTGKATQKTALELSKSIVSDLNKPGDLGALQGIGVTVGQATAALLQGSAATQQYTTHLQALLTAEKGDTAISQTRIAALRGLISSMENQNEVLGQSNTDYSLNAQAQQAAADAARELGLANDAAAASVRASAVAAQNASAQQTIFQLGLDGIANAAADVQARIDAIPPNVRITASAVGLDSITAQADAAFAAMSRLLALFGQANNPATGGERHGADVTTTANTAAGQASRQLSAAMAAADAAYKRALAAIKNHNASVHASSGGHSGGGASSAAANAVSAARQALITQVTDSSFISNLLDADAKGIGRIGATLARGAAAALTHGRDTALTRLIRRDTVALAALATRRAAVAKKMQDAQDNLTNLTQAKASTVSQVSDSAMGNLVGARSASGVLRVLNRQLKTVTAFRANLGILAKRGLPKAFLQQLIAAGVDGAMTAAALVRANDTDFANITALTNQLSSQATGLGNDAGSLLYDQGIAAAQGLIRGLKSQQAAIDAQMLAIAKSMQTAIKRALGIKSPSTVFAALGRQIPAGLSVGIDAGTPEVHRKVATMVPTSGGYSMAGPSSGQQTARVNAPITIHGSDPIETATKVSNHLVWMAKR